MEPHNLNVQRTILAMLPPVVAFVVQWSFWSAFQPFVWFLFYPAVFLSAWIGGLIPGMFSTFISAGIVWWFFMPPQFSFSLPNPMALVSIIVFCMMGGLFGFTIGRMKELIKRSDEVNDTLRASEERYRLLVDGVKDVANIMLDVSGHVITWNQGAERLKGYTAEEIIGCHYSIFYPSDAVASGKPMAELVQVREQGRAEDEGWRVRKDGSQFWAYIVITPLYNDKGEIQGFSKITRDISERKAAQDQLRVSEENLSVTLDSIGDGVMATDAAGRVTRLNAVAERLTGWSQTEAAGRPVDEIFRIINQETRMPAKIPVIATLAHGTIQGPANHAVLIARDGSECAIADSCAPIRDRDGQVIGAVLVFRDVTKEYAAQAALRDSAAQVQTILNTVVDGIITFHARGGIVETVNPAVERMFGYTAAELVGQSFSLLIPELDRDQRNGNGSLEYYGASDEARAIGLGRAVVGRREDGSIFPMEMAVSEMWLGGQCYFTGILRDITARQQAEEALLKAGALQSAIFNSANFSSIATDAKGVIQIFNVGAERMLGYTALEVMNKITPADISDPQEVIARATALSVELDTPITPGFEALVFKASRGIEDIYELTYIRKDGSRFPAVVSVTALRDAQNVIIGYLLIGTDNTARKQAEEIRAHMIHEESLRQINAELEQRVQKRTAELEETGERLREVSARVTAIVGTMVDGVLTIDEQGTVETINPAAERMFGYPAAEVIGQNVSMLVPEPHRSAHDGYLARYRASGEARNIGFVREVVGRRQDGSTFPLKLAVNEIRLDDKRKFVGIVRDISALKHAVALREDALKAAEVANLAKTDFLANMSHEIRSPLNAILGLVYLLEQAHLDQDAHTMVRKIRVSGRMLLSLISDILDMSKIEASQMMIEQAPFRLDDVIDNVAVALGLAVGEKDIELIIQPLPAGVSTVIGDALRLEQVLINLSSNAIKFTPSGRVELRIELLSRNEDQIMLRFCVRDTGIGIAPELQNGVFSAFTQADTSTTRRFGGTGLGLTICRQLVSLMGGDIGVISTPGEGSEFWFTLPLQHAADAHSSSPSMVRVDALIADDSAIALQAISAVAQSLGWQVGAADSGAAVLAQVLERKSGKLPDVVVLDWQMPGMDGLATARAIREGVPENECPIVIMATAYSLSTLASQPGAELVDAVLQKPVTASSLYNAVMKAQRRRATTVGVLPALMKTASDGLAGVRVLVVDDSDINRDVAQHILSGQGALVSLAVDGQDALDWLLAHPNEVDLVLMDVQMPVMDGIEATRQLRRLPQFEDLPIVALTAGAFKSQQEAAYAAGMTHFVSKPFDVPSTIALIQRLRRPSTLAQAVAPARAVVTPVSPTALDSSPEISVMDVAQGLQIWSDVRTYRDYLRRFVDSYSNAMDVMNMSLATGDRPAAAALAHKLSGVAANLALPDTRKLASEAERVLSTEYDPTLTLNRLSDSLAAAVAEIERYAPQQPVAIDVPFAAVPASGAMSPETQAGLKTLLIELLAALDTDNPAPAKTILATLGKKLPQQALAGIWACVLGFDFRGAEASTLRLASEHGIALKE